MGMNDDLEKNDDVIGNERNECNMNISEINAENNANSDAESNADSSADSDAESNADSSSESNADSSAESNAESNTDSDAESNAGSPEGSSAENSSSGNPGDISNITNYDNFGKRRPGGAGSIGGNGMRGIRGTHGILTPPLGSKNNPLGGNRKPDMKKIGLISRIIAAVVIVLIIVGNSFYNVDEQHNAVVTQFGKVVRTDTAGLHFKIPIIQKVNMVDMTTHGVGIGYSDGGYDPFNTGMTYNSSDYYNTNSVMITSDFNLLDIDFYLEYKVSDPVAYLYNSISPEEILFNMAFAAIRSTVVNFTVDEAMTTGKSQIQGEIKEKLQAWLLDENIGMQVVNVQIQDAQPPTATIQSAFKEVENAKQSKDTALNNARQYQNEQVPKAEAEADRIRQNAEASKAARIAEAEGQASRFNTMYEQYQANPLITRQRLFFEAMEEVLPGKKVIITDGNTQELLPIDSFSTMTGGATND